MTDERYKAIMADLGMPNSRSLLSALRQVANEVAQAERAAFTEYQKLQGEQEPVAWILPTQPPRIVDHMNFNANYGGTVTPLYTAPPDLTKRIAELEAHEKQLCAWVDENGTSKELVQEICKQRDELTAQNAQLREVAVEVREACLFVDDDGEVRVSNEPCIDSITFDNMCAAIKSDNSADWLRKHDAQVLRNATKEVEQMWSDNFGRDCESAYARVLHKLQSMAKELEGERNEHHP